MRHLKVANTRVGSVPTAQREASEICLVDYAHCPNADLCWIADFDSGCVVADSCIIDTQ